MRFVSSGLRDSEQGVSTIELALLLPLLFILISGIVDIGLGLRTVQVVSDAARNAALRTARSLLTQVDQQGNPLDPLQNPPQCSGSVQQALTTFTACDDLTRPPLTLLQNGGVDEACSILDAQLNKNDWQIAVRVANHSEDNQAVGMLTVRIEAKPSAKNCFFCFGVTQLPIGAFSKEKTYPMTVPCV